MLIINVHFYVLSQFQTSDMCIVCLVQEKEKYANKEQPTQSKTEVRSCIKIKEIGKKKITLNKHGKWRSASDFIGSKLLNHLQELLKKINKQNKYDIEMIYISDSMNELGMFVI